VNPVVSSGLDVLPTIVNMAGGTLDSNIVVDGSDLSDALRNPASFDSEPVGDFVYWCGNSIM
jgi:hypothetical protein